MKILHQNEKIRQQGENLLLKVRVWLQFPTIVSSFKYIYAYFATHPLRYRFVRPIMLVGLLLNL